MILTSNRATEPPGCPQTLMHITHRGGSPVDWYPPFLNPDVAESLLDRLISSSHQAFMNGPSYRPIKRPGANQCPRRLKTDPVSTPEF